MSSPARSSSSATSVGAQASAAGGSGTACLGGVDDSAFHFPTDLISTQDRKEEALAVLKTELMAVLQEEVKSLDEDSWKFAGPRSQIHLISRPGGFSLKPTPSAGR